MFVTGEHMDRVTKEKHRLLIIKNCTQEMSENCVFFGPSGQFLDIPSDSFFDIFSGHFVSVPIFWAVQRFADYKFPQKGL